MQPKIIVNMNEDTTQLSIQDETFLDTACQRILSLDIKGSLFGASCLNVETKTLQIYEDSQINHPEVYIESLVDDFNPTIVFISSRTTATVVSLLEDIKNVYQFKFYIKIVADFTKFDTKRLVESFYNLENNNTVHMFSTSALKSLNLRIAVCIYSSRSSGFLQRLTFPHISARHN